MSAATLAPARQRSLQKTHPGDRGGHPQARDGGARERRGPSGTARMVLTVHDELVFEVPEGDAEKEGERIRGLMQHAMKLSVPLVVDVGSARNWALAH